MKSILEFNQLDLESIVKEYCSRRLAHDNRYLSNIKFSIPPSEERGKREYVCTVEYDYTEKDDDNDYL